MRFNYTNQENNPSKPCCLISIHNPNKPELFKDNIEALVDSGASMTCIPESMLTNIGNLTISQLTMRSASGNTVPRNTYIINIKIAGSCFPETQKIEVMSIPGEYALIGRDILNQYKIVLDASQNKWGLCGDRICT